MFQIDLTEPMPDEVALLIGKIAIAFGRLEYVRIIAYKREARLPLIEGLRRAEAARHRDELSQKIKDARALRLMDQDAEMLMIAVCDQFDAVCRERDELLHACWARHPDGQIKYRPPRQDWRPLDLEELSRVLSNILIVADNLNRLAGSSAPHG
jgi:hypothetical protein